MRCGNHFPDRVQCYIIRYGNCSACRGGCSACCGCPADKSLAVRRHKLARGERICARGDIGDVRHRARPAVGGKADGEGSHGRRRAADRNGCLDDREVGGDLLKGLAGDKFKLRQSQLLHACCICVDGAAEGSYHGVRRARVVRGGGGTVDDAPPGRGILREGNVVKAELRLKPRSQRAGARDISQSRRNIQYHLD